MGRRILTLSLLLLLTAGVGFAEIRDGKLFDPGTQLTEPSERAPKDLAKFSDFVGNWDVTLETFAAGKDTVRSEGRAQVTYVNRGHSYMERTRIADFNGQGHDLAALAFLSVDSNGAWAYGEADTWTEAVSIASGGFEGDRLVLHSARRPGGGITFQLIRRTLEAKDDGFVLTTETSTDMGKQWTTTQQRTYRRSAVTENFFPVRDDLGLPAPDRSAEASQFDFLVGEYATRTFLKFGPQTIRWPAQTTAVYALDGRAIFEFNWNDYDPSLPDSATSILRLYNHAERRWESLYISNRASTPLHFGGVMEGDRLTLHPFDAVNDGTALSKWVFFDVRDNSYRWKGLVSQDRGASYGLTWGIDMDRQGADLPDAKTAPPTQVHTVSADGVTIYGDYYRPAWPGSPTVVLFHQAGGDARGEYSDIARKLVAEGYEVFAWDARTGGERFGQSNRTVAALAAAEPPSYCDAYPDLEAGLQYASDYGSGHSMFAVGSSYSAALVVRLAAEHGRDLAGVAAFSPASGRMDDCAVETWLPKVGDTPVLTFRPESETSNESVQAQTEQLEAQGVEVFVAPDGVHGASMLNADKVDGDVEATWTRFLAFLADPSGQEKAAAE